MRIVVYLKKHLIKGLKGILSLALSLISNSFSFFELLFSSTIEEGTALSMFPSVESIPLVSLKIIPLVGGILNNIE